MIKNNFRYPGAKRIAIFANYRSASSYTHRQVVNANNIDGLGEYFAEVGRQEGDLPFDKAMSNLQNIHRYTIKIMANQLKFDQDKIKAVLELCDKIVYVYRRDFRAQALSLISVSPNKLYSLMGFAGDGQKPTEVIVPILSEAYIKSILDLLKDNYFCMAQFIKTHPGEIICLEDLHQQKPYLKTTIWQQPVPEFEDFNVEKVLFG